MLTSEHVHDSFAVPFVPEFNGIPAARMRPADETVYLCGREQVTEPFVQTDFTGKDRPARGVEDARIAEQGPRPTYHRAFERIGEVAFRVFQAQIAVLAIKREHLAVPIDHLPKGKRPVSIANQLYMVPLQHSVVRCCAIVHPVFADEFGRLIADPDHSQDEDRFVLLGMSVLLRVLVVCHCYRNGDTIRIISARKADRSERTQYEGYKYA